MQHPRLPPKEIHQGNLDIAAAMHMAFGGGLRISFGRHDHPRIRYSAQDMFLAGYNAIGEVIGGTVALMVEADGVIAVSLKDMKREFTGNGSGAGYKALHFANETTEA